MTVKQRKVLFWLVILFLVLWLYSDPQSLGDATRALFRGLASLFAAFREFVTAIVS